MKTLTALVLALACGACVPDQRSVRTVEAVEIPLKSNTDRSDLVTLLRRHASVDGTMHVDDGTKNWREFERQNGPTLPGGKGTIFVGVWRGKDDDEPVAAADDMGHPNRAWLTFARGVDADRATRFREAVMADVRERWPDARSLPIMPTGAIPLPQDLKLTDSGYKVARNAAANYELPPSSPLVDRN